MKHFSLTLYVNALTSEEAEALFTTMLPKGRIVCEGFVHLDGSIHDYPIIPDGYRLVQIDTGENEHEFVFHSYIVPVEATHVHWDEMILKGWSSGSEEEIRKEWLNFPEGTLEVGPDGWVPLNIEDKVVSALKNWESQQSSYVDEDLEEKYE